ncbi:MAG TPA: glycosyltransferase family protein, partial [Myxococcaceae bacterium]|nr:glycosyltransferase family protein [Myxococcaceae bacterium]
RPPMRKERTTLIPPLLRREILEALPEPGDHLLVYQTAEGASALPAILRKADVPSRVYGFRRDLSEDVTEGNVTYRPFSEPRFIEDLRTARAVIASGGFTLMSEAVYLRKPVLAVPLVGHFEQVLNALYLQKLGYGVFAKELTPEVLTEFLRLVPKLSEGLKQYQQDGNSEAFAAVDAQLARALERRRGTRRKR